jgi:hypothetical protein
MDHHEATRLMAVEKYLLKELPPELRDEFEEHFFDCPECSADLRATEAFLAATQKELATAPISKPSPAIAKKSPFEFLWRPVFALPAFALLLLAIAYQGAVIYPRQASEIAQLQAPRILPTLSLAGGNSRGGETPAIAVPRHQPFVLSVDIPTQDRFSSYTCLLYSPSGSTAFRIHVSAQQAKDTVSISVPAADSETGSYTLAVQGNTDRTPSEAAVDLAHYRFEVRSKN